MKTLRLSIGLIFMSFLAQAQNISQIEYFIDNDPGIGNGTALSFTSASEVTKSFSFPLNSLADGFHLLSVRAQDSDGDWGNTTYRVFAKYSTTLGVTPTPENIVKVEYFIDNDPGHDNGTVIPITAGQSLNNLAFSFPVTSLADGFHVLSVRAKNADGNWGNTNYRYFVKFDTSPPVNAAPSPIVYVEYFVDNDPGAGNGTSVPVTSSAELNKQLVNVELNGLSNGVHLLSMRAKNANGDWNQVTYQEFTVKDNVVALGSGPVAFCRETAFTVPFNVSGTFSPSNVFTLQLSDVSGSFTTPTVLATSTTNSSGTFNVSIPVGVTVGPGYFMRIVASDPANDEQPLKLFEVLAICPPPCATSLTLQSTADDYSSGIVLKEASSTNGTITATNKITGNAKVTYNAGRSVELQPGFTAGSGTVFLVEMGGCE